MAQRIHGENGAGLEIVSDGRRIDANSNGLSLAGIRVESRNLVALAGSRVEEGGRHRGIERNARWGSLNTGDRASGPLDRRGCADVHDIEHASGAEYAAELNSRDDSKPAAIRTAVGIDGDGDGILIHSDGRSNEFADRGGGERSEIDGGNRIRKGVGDDRKVRFLVDGHTDGRGADGDVGNAYIPQSFEVHRIDDGGGVRGIVSDNGDP